GDGDPPASRNAERRSCESRRLRRHGCRGGRLLNQVDSSDEPVATARHGFDETWALGDIAEAIAQPVDDRVEAVVEVDERVRLPQPAAQLLARYDLTGPLEQRHENLKRLLLKPEPDPVFSQLPSRRVEFK